MSRLLNRNFLNTTFNKNLTKNFYTTYINNSKIFTNLEQNNISLTPVKYIKINNTPIVYNNLNNKNRKINFYKANIEILNSMENISNNIKNNNIILDNPMKKFYIKRVYEREKIKITNKKLNDNYNCILNELLKQEEKLGIIVDKLFDEKISNEIRNDFDNIKNNLIILKQDLSGLNDKILSNEKIDIKKFEKFEKNVNKIVEMMANAIGNIILLILEQIGLAIRRLFFLFISFQILLSLTIIRNH